MSEYLRTSSDHMFADTVKMRTVRTVIDILKVLKSSLFLVSLAE
jgi:hypothetical protein